MNQETWDAVDRYFDEGLSTHEDVLDAALASENFGPVDLTFIDADKENNAAYFDWALKLSRSGAVIVVDNVVRRGAVADAHSADSAVLGVRRLVDRIASEPRVSATAIQTVGTKATTAC